jgi:3-oxoacyl-[acyl-carrier protein] reductase
MSTAFSLDGRRAIVTGSASGIGAAIAQAYASAGARLVLAEMPHVSSSKRKYAGN